MHVVLVLGFDLLKAIPSDIRVCLGLRQCIMAMYHLALPLHLKECRQHGHGIKKCCGDMFINTTLWSSS